MKITHFVSTITLSAFLLVPVIGLAQETQQERHDDAKESQTAHDHRHHTGAKIVGGSAVGGAVAGGLLGGPKGAVIGAGVGAGGGAIANKVRVDKGVKAREKREYHDEHDPR